MGLSSKLRRSIKRLPFNARRLRKELPLPYSRDGIDYRLLAPEDSLERLTELINQAYYVHQDAGLNYKGASQSLSETKMRIRHAYTIVALDGKRIVGTVSYKPPWECRGSEWFNRKGVAKYNQRAVDPEYQSKGIGGTLVDLAELFAILHGAREVSSDHAEGAIEVDRKKRRGYRFVSYHQWSFTNYRSVIMSKNLESFNS